MDETSELMNSGSNEDKSIVKNPNSIGEIVDMGYNDVKTSPDKVYRSIYGPEAIKDLFACGFVRNRQSAGLGYNRYGETVFWSRGKDGNFHNVQDNGFLIVAPFEIASQRVVREGDVTAIYAKEDGGKIVDILESERDKRKKI